MNHTNGSSGLISILGFVPWILVVVGWVVVSRQNDLRERRKDIRELIKFLGERLERVLSSWSDYYALDGNDVKAGQLAAKIKSDISSLRLFVERLNQAGLSYDASGDLRLFRQQATGGEFENIDRKAAIFDHEHYGMLSLIAMDFVRSIEQVYFSTYSTKFEYWINMDRAFSYFIRARQSANS